MSNGINRFRTYGRNIMQAQKQYLTITREQAVNLIPALRQTLEQRFHIYPECVNIKCASDPANVNHLTDDALRIARLVYTAPVTLNLGLNVFWAQYPINKCVSTVRFERYLENILSEEKSLDSYVNQKGIFKMLRFFYVVGTQCAGYDYKVINEPLYELDNYTKLMFKLAFDVDFCPDNKDVYLPLDDIRKAISATLCDTESERGIMYTLGAVYNVSTATTQASQMRGMLASTGVAKRIKWKENDVLIIDHRFIGFLKEFNFQ